MADVFDAETRSRIMRSVRSFDTKPELALKAALTAAGIRWRSRTRAGKLPGKPDVLVPSADLAVFVHGCFWHMCPDHYRPPAPQRWRDKIDGNRRRDARVRRRLRILGWRTLVVWEHEDPARAVRRIRRVVEAMP